MKKYSKLLLGLVVTLSIAISLATLSKWSVWHDEGYTLSLIENGPSEIISRTAYDVHPPLYYLVLKAYTSVLGDNIVTLRSMSIVFGLLSALVLFLLSRRLYGRKVAYIATSLLLLNPAFIRYSQEARMYTLAMFLLLSATYLLVELIQKPKRLYVLGLYSLCAGSLVYTHYFASLGLLIHPVMIYFSLGARDVKSVLRSRIVRTWAVGVLIAIVAFLPWLPLLLRQGTIVSYGFWIPKISVESFFSTIASFIVFRPTWLHWAQTELWSLLAFVQMAIVAYACRSVYKSSLTSTQKLVLIGGWSVPMLVLYFVSVFPGLTSLYYDRYFVSFVPFFSLLLAFWMSAMTKSIRSRLPRLLLVALMIFGLVRVSIYGNNYGHKSDDYYQFKQIIDQSQIKNLDRALWLTNDIGHYFSVRYYLRQIGLEKNIYLVRDDLGVGLYGSISSVSGDVSQILTPSAPKIASNYSTLVILDNQLKPEDISALSSYQAIRSEKLVVGNVAATKYVLSAR
jgi:mannosyltransferase